MKLPALLLAIGTSALAGYAWWRYEMRWLPDSDLYMQGGIGLYPSPVGRLLGMVELVFVSASVAAAGTVVYCSAVTKDKSGLSATPRALVLVVSPFVLYLTFVSADVIALGLYAVFLYSGRFAWLLLGVVTHLALIPYALLHVAAADRLSRLQKFTIGYFAGGTVAVVLMVTPYGGIVFIDRGFWSAAGYGLVLAALVGLPALAFYRLGALHWCAFAVGALECGLQNHAQARYFLPAILLLAATGRPRFGEVRTPSGGSYRFGLTPRSPSEMVGVAPGLGAAADRSSTRRLRRIQEGTLR